MNLLPLRRALLSVTDKTGLADFARELAAAGVELYSTGGTRQHLEQAGLQVIDVATYTGFPEMLDGRVKTLHPKVFGGILARRDKEDHVAALREHGIVEFDLVVVNLYAFEETIRRPGVTLDEAKEQVDIGGPSLIRAAAKNHLFAAIATDPRQYSAILAELREQGGVTLSLRRRLAADAFARTAAYDRAIADYFAQVVADEARGATESPAGDRFPERITIELARDSELRYGENPHQGAALYFPTGDAARSLVRFRKLHGKELSYNNLLDVDSAWSLARSLGPVAASVIKHNNPCGAAIGASAAEAAQRALDGDPQSAFGSVIALSTAVDRAAAEVFATPGLFIEVIAAPSFTSEALEILTTVPKWKNSVRLLAVDDPRSAAPLQFRILESGVLVQESDSDANDEAAWKNVTDAPVSEQLLADLRLAWNVVRAVKSNAIVVANGGAVVGVGAGQMSRVDSVEIALRKAGDRARGAALASDAFFPFPDSIERAAAAGIAAAIQPGGSVKDSEVIAAAQHSRLAMLLTGRRHFRH